MKSKIFIGLMAVLLCFEFALATYSILAHKWIGLAVVTLLIFGVMYVIDREVRRMRGEVPPQSTTTKSDNTDTQTR